MKNFPGSRIRKKSIFLDSLFFFFALCFSSIVYTQIRVDVSGVGATSYPILIADFSLNTLAETKFLEVLQKDLLHSGVFQVIRLNNPVPENAPLDSLSLRTQNAHAILRGSVSQLPNGNYYLNFRLDSTDGSTHIGHGNITSDRPDLERTGHRIADWIYEKITGEKGVFSTRIAFVSRQGSRYRLNVSDWDGTNILSPLTSSEPIISPAWSPNGKKLAYVSFESHKPVVYVHELSSGTRKVIANFKGSNSAPSWSPDSTTVALTLTKDGSSQIYLIKEDGSEPPKRIAASGGINTEAQFSPDGQSLYFTSDRGGSPQIYKAFIQQPGVVSRTTFQSSYSVSPSISPDGQLMAFICKENGQFLLTVQDLSSGTIQFLSETGEAESPSFSPNGKWILYTSRGKNKKSLVATNLSGSMRLELSTTTDGDIRDPSWGPFQ